MTALDQFSRIEAIAEWHVGAGAPAREVVVKFGDARLTICDMKDSPLTQWSIAAISERAGHDGKIELSPEEGFTERLLLDDGVLVEAIRKVHAGLKPEKTTAQRWGRRIAWITGITAAITLAVWISLPAALGALTARIEPQTWQRLSVLALRAELSDAQVCAGLGSRALNRLAARLGLPEGRIRIARGLESGTLMLVDGTVLIPAQLLDQSIGPGIPAAAILEAQSRADMKLPAALAREMGWTAMRLLFTTQITQSDVDAMRNVARALPVTPESDQRFARAMEAAGLPTTPYAEYLLNIGQDLRAQDIAALDRIGAASYQPALNDNDWVRLQARCAQP